METRLERHARDSGSGVGDYIVINAQTTSVISTPVVGTVTSDGIGGSSLSLVNGRIVVNEPGLYECYLLGDTSLTAGTAAHLGFNHYVEGDPGLDTSPKYYLGAYINIVRNASFAVGGRAEHTQTLFFEKGQQLWLVVNGDAATAQNYSTLILTKVA